jgi:hypothetical protein
VNTWLFYTFTRHVGDLPNGLMRSYIAVPTYLMELFVKFFILSWVVERWNLSSVSLLLSRFLKSIGQNMILQYYGFSTLGTRALFLVCGSSPRFNRCSFSSYHLKAKYVELIGKGEEYNSSYVYYQAKGWSKRVNKIFSMILEKVFKMV